MPVEQASVTVVVELVAVVGQTNIVLPLHVDCCPACGSCQPPDEARDHC